MQPLNSLRPTIRAVSLPFPMDLFGVHGKTLKKVTCIIVDLVETIATMLVNTDVVGRNGVKFKLSYSSECNDNGEKTFGNVTSALWFKKTEKTIRRQWGHQVNLLAFAIACDKTHVDRVGGISVWPCYITLLNLDTSVRRTARGSDIIGYLPILPYSDTQLSYILKNSCGVKRKLDEAVKMTKYSMEQSFYFNIMEPIRKCETDGPIRLQVGEDNANVYSFIPKLMVYICK